MLEIRGKIMCDLCRKYEKEIADPNSKIGKILKAKDAILDFIGETTGPNDWMGKPNAQIYIMMPEPVADFIQEYCEDHDLDAPKMVFTMIQAAIVAGMDEMLDLHAAAHEKGRHAANSDYSASEKDLSNSLGEEMSNGLREILRKKRTLH